MLELARRDAERVDVGKVVGAHAWPQERISARIVAEARRGRRVVRLKSGDPAIFGRAGEEVAAAEAAGVPVEIVPGITAASGLAAATGHALTTRGETDTIVLATGRCRDADGDPDWGAHVVPGTTLVLYMAAGRAGEIAARLISAGAGAETRVTLGSALTRRDETITETTLARLGEAVPDPTEAPVLIRITFPKSAAHALAASA